MTRPAFRRPRLRPTRTDAPQRSKSLKIKSSHDQACQPGLRDSSHKPTVVRGAPGLHSDDQASVQQEQTLPRINVIKDKKVQWTGLHSDDQQERTTTTINVIKNKIIQWAGLHSDDQACVQQEQSATAINVIKNQIIQWPGLHSDDQTCVKQGQTATTSNVIKNKIIQWPGLLSDDQARSLQEQTATTINAMHPTCRQASNKNTKPQQATWLGKKPPARPRPARRPARPHARIVTFHLTKRIQWPSMHPSSKIASNMQCLRQTSNKNTKPQQATWFEQTKRPARPPALPPARV